MKKMNVVLSGWLAVFLLAGHPTNGFSHDNHGDAGKGTTARPKALNVPLPAEYEQLKASLEKVDSRGLTVKASIDVDAKSKDLSVSVADVVRIRAWLQDTFKTYRQSLTTCAVARDKSSDLFGQVMDEFIAKLATSLTDDPKNASGLKEKELITYVTQMERFTKEKASRFSSSKADFEKADEKLIDQLKRTVGSFYGGFHSDQFDVVKQYADAETKSIADKGTAALDALAAHEAAGGKACKLVEEKLADEGKAGDEGQDKDKTGDKGGDKDKGKQAKLNPGPIEGGNPQGDGGKTGEKEKEKGPADPGGGAPPGGDPGVPFFNPGDNQAANDFDADALLKGVVDRFAQLEQQQKLDNDRAKQDLQNAVDAAKRLGDDIARQQQAAIDAQKNNDNGLADALGRLATQQQPPPPPPAPPAPPPTIIPPQDNGNQAQQPFLPPQDDGGGQQQPPPQGMPFMPQQQQSQPPIIIGDDSKGYFQDDYLRPRPAVVQQVNPQAGGLLELVRLQQQLAMAQQQAQYGYGPNGQRMNVNTMANRLSGGGAGAPVARRVVPGSVPRTGAATQSGPAGARSTTAPAALRGSLAQ